MIIGYLTVQSGSVSIGNIKNASLCINNSTSQININSFDYPSKNLFFTSSNLSTNQGVQNTSYSDQIVHTITLASSTTLYFNAFFVFTNISSLTSSGGYFSATRLA